MWTSDSDSLASNCSEGQVLNELPGQCFFKFELEIDQVLEIDLSDVVNDVLVVEQASVIHIAWNSLTARY